MRIAATLDQLHTTVKHNRWLRYFAVFNRLALAAGFIPAGIVKLTGERFASGLAPNHPMGHYLVALHQTGYYYTFIGLVQLIAAILLLIPRMATLGAFLYFPIIVNICVLSFAVRFDGSLFTSPLMVLANLYLLGWYYDKWKYMLPFNRIVTSDELPAMKSLNNTFPTLFFAGILTTVIVFATVVPRLYRIRPRNTYSQCIRQFRGSNRTKAGYDFCDCIHQQGRSLGGCLDAYNQAPNDSIPIK